MVTAEPLTLIMSALSFMTLALPGPPPPKYRYAWPSSSMNAAGSNIHVTPLTPGVLDVMIARPTGSVNGPVGLVLLITPMLPPPLPK